MNNIFKYRHLILNLAITNFKLKYKNSILGFFWSLLEPFFMLVVLYVVFSSLMKTNVEHYQLFLLLGIICWGFFEKGTSMGINSIIGNQFIVFVIFMLFFQVMPGIYSLFVPIILIFELMIIYGISLAISAINVSYRDIQYIWKVILQAGFFGTPILYQTSMLPSSIVPYMYLNPMARIIELMRNIVIYRTDFNIYSFEYLSVVSLIFIIIGYKIFKKYEPYFAENI